MSPEKQRIAIAEACGWKIGPPLVRPDGLIENAHYSEEWRLPDYLNDLNAIIPAVKCHIQHSPSLRYLYFRTLLGVMKTTHHGDAAIANASEHAEALLRLIGKWEDKQ